MTNELKETIKNFLVDYQDADLDNWATTDLLLITAVSLLEQVVENKMRQYIVKYYWPKNHHEVYSFVCMADDVEHAIEQCEDAYPNNCHVLSVDILENN